MQPQPHEVVCNFGFRSSRSLPSLIAAQICAVDETEVQELLTAIKAMRNDARRWLKNFEVWAAASGITGFRTGFRSRFA